MPLFFFVLVILVLSVLNIVGKMFRYNLDHLTIRPVARKGYGPIAHEAKPNGLLTRGP